MNNNTSYLSMKKCFLNLIVCLLIGALLPSCSDENFEVDYKDLYESKIEQEDGKVILKFVMPFVINRIQSGEMANIPHKLRLISLDKSDLMNVLTKFKSEGENRTSVEMEFPEGKMDINGKYVLCITPLKAAGNTTKSQSSEDETVGTERCVIEIEGNSVTSVTKASSMTGFAYGDGSEDNPYQICGADDFYMLIYNLYKDDTDAVGIFFKQMEDFSWTDVEDKSISTGMNKIESFAGIYDGNGRNISDMSYQGTNTSNYTNVGLFSELKNGAEIKNLNFSNISFRNVSRDCGAIAGSASGNITIDNVSITGTMTFENMGDNIGGILGSHKDGVLKISNITNNLTISGANYNVGGVVGYVKNATFEFNNFRATTTQYSLNGYCFVGSVVGKISNSGYSINNVNVNHIIPDQDKDVFIISGRGTGIGGVIGYADMCSDSSLSEVTIRTSVGSSGTLDDFDTNILKPYGQDVGGLIGISDSNGTTTIRDVKVSGHIKGDTNVGGFIGSVQTFTYTNTSLAFKGTNYFQPEESSYTDVSGRFYVGGLIGVLAFTTLTIEKPIIIKTNVTGSIYGIGGFCGYMVSSVCNLTNLQFSETMTVSGSDQVGGVIGEIYSSKVTGSTKIDFTNGNQSALPNFNDLSSLFNGKVIGSKDVGGFAGKIDDSSVTGFAVNANVTGSTNVGGFAGMITICDSDDIVSSNAFNGNVTGTGENVAGIVGCLEMYAYTDPFNSLGFNNNIAYGSVSGGGNVSGVVGYLYTNEANFTLQYCVNAGKVVGFGHVGGVLAHVYEKHNAPIVQFCANFGEITATANNSDCNVGGIVGFAKLKPMQIYYCTNHGNISASGTYKGVGGVAGEVGHNTGTVSCKDNAYVKYCANFGNISADNAESYVGGIVGFMQEGSVSKGNCCLYDCYNRGEILSDHTEDTGGILGQADHYNTVYRNINFGKVHYGNAIIGYRKNGNCILYVDDNYFLEGSGKDWKATDSFSESEIGKSSTYKGFDFSSVWEIVDGYPYIRNNPFQRTSYNK